MHLRSRPPAAMAPPPPHQYVPVYEDEAPPPPPPPLAPLSVEATTAATKQSPSAQRRAWAISALGWWCFVIAIATRPGGALRIVDGPAAVSHRASTVRFLVLGGWASCGGGSASAANLLASVAATGTLAPAFVLSAGDNFLGPLSVGDGSFRSHFGSVFAQPSLQSLPWFAVPGDGDWLRNASALADPALQALDARWNGGLWSGANVTSDHYADPSDAAALPGSPLLSVFYVDTTPWLGWARANATLSAKWPGRLANAPTTSLATLDLWQAWEDAQSMRLAAALAASGARWKIVVGHASIYTYAAGGGAPELGRLNGILRRGGAHAYLSGQAGGLEVIAAASPAPLYVATGAGAPCSTGLPASSPANWSSPMPGVWSVEVNSTALVLKSYLATSPSQPAFVLSSKWTASPQCTVGAPGMLGANLPADPRCGLAPASPSPAPAPPVSRAPTMDLYASLSELVLPGGSDWDFITYDSASQTVLSGRRADGVSIVDARNASALVYKSSVPSTFGTNGVTLLPDLGLAISVNGALGAASGTVFVLPSAANNWVAQVLGVTTFTSDLNSPGNAVYHPGQFKVAFTHHHRSNASGALPSVLGVYSLHPSLRGCPANCPAACPDPTAGCLSLVSSPVIRMGKLHSPKVADATSVWLAVEVPGAVVRVSLVTGAILQTFNLRSAGCARVTPIDLDDSTGTMFVGCAGAALAGGAGLFSPLLLALNSSTGAVLYSSPVGRHVDDLYYVPKTATRTGRVFITCSGDATILVFEQLAGGALRPLEAVATQMGTKTMDFDVTRRIIFTGAPKGSCGLGGVALDSAAAAMAVGGEPFYPTGNSQGTCPIAPGLQWWQNGTWRLMAFQAQNNM